MTVSFPLMSLAAGFSPTTKTLWIAFIAVLFLLIIATIVYMVHNRRRLQAEEDEKRRLAAALEQTKKRQKAAEQKLLDATAKQEQTEKKLSEALLVKASVPEPEIIELNESGESPAEKAAEEEKNRAFLATTAFLVGSDFELVSVIDLAGDSFEVFGAEHADALTPGAISYTDASRSFALDLCVPEDRDKVLWQTSIQGLREQLKGREYFELTADVSESGLRKRKIMRFTRFNGSDDTLLATRRDVTELMEREARQKTALTSALLEAESAQNEKSEFLSSMGKAVRERLSEVLILSAAAEEEAESAASKDAFHSIKESGSAVTSMLTNVLDVLELEGGKLSPAADYVDVPDFMADIRARTQRTAEKKKVAYTLRTGGAVPKRLCFDRARAARVLGCVLDNAVAFTAEGGDISHTVTYSAPANSRIYIRHVVTDTGCGMRTEFAKTAFEPFTREHNTEGAGLGLYIAKHLAEALDGSIDLESAEGVGTTVTFTLPAKAVG